MIWTLTSQDSYIVIFQTISYILIILGNQKHIEWDIEGRVFQGRYIHRNQNPKANHELGKMRDLKYHVFLQLMMILIVLVFIMDKLPTIMSLLWIVTQLMMITH